MRFIEVSEYGEQQFYRLTGVKREVFELMIEVLSAARNGRGRRPTLSIADQLLLTVCYWREYRSQFHVASRFGVSEATVCRTVKQVESALLKDQRFHLPGKKALHDGSLDLTVIVVDASEQRVERPQKKQRRSYSGKKKCHTQKCHTQKGQIVIDRCSQKILCVAVSAGKTHDFALFKDSRLALAPSLELLADTGYQGVDKLHPKSQTPHKKSKHHPLTTEQKRQNKALASRRISIEHVLRTLKRFRLRCFPNQICNKI